MDKRQRFVILVQTEILYECLRNQTSVSPGSAVATAMEIPPHVLDDDLQDLYEQAREFVMWFAYDAPEPDWVPEHILYEEVYIEVEEEIE